MLLIAVGTSLVRRGHPHEGLRLARRTLDLARRVGSLRAQLEAGEQIVGLLRVTGAYREGIDVGDEVRADTAGLELQEPPRLLGELALTLAAAGDEARAVSLAQELIAARSAAIGQPFHNSPALDAASALMSFGRMPDQALIDRERPSCRTCQVGWHRTAGRQAALSGDRERALGLAADLDALTRGGHYPIHAGWVASIRALAWARAGRTDDAARAIDEARAGFRSVGSVHGEDLLDHDLAAISAVHA